jgi:hypothetical protein
LKRRHATPGATEDPRVVRLLALQNTLGLTAFQRRFVEALAVDLERNQTRAALAAGAPRKGAAVQASRLLRLAKVRTYFHALTREAEEARGQATHAAVAHLTEILTTLTSQMRARAGDYIIPLPEGGFAVDIDAVRNAPPGVVRDVSHDRSGEVMLTFADSLAAAKVLLAYYTHKPPRPDASGNLTVNTVIDGLPEDLVVALFRAMALASGCQPVGPLST